MVSITIFASFRKVCSIRGNSIGTLCLSALSVFALLAFPILSRAGASTDLLEDLVLSANWQAILERFVSARKPESPTQFIVAHAYLARNRNNESLCLFRQLQDRAIVENWERWTRQLVTRYGGSAVAHYLHGDALARQMLWDMALLEFNRALQPVMRADSPTQSLVLNARGTLLVIAGRSGEAGNDFSRAIMLAPNLADARASLGTHAIRARREVQTIEEMFDAALQVNADFALAVNGSGVAAAAAGRFDDAEVAFLRAGSLAHCLGVAAYNLLELTDARAKILRADADILLTGLEAGTTINESLQQTRQAADAGLNDLNNLSALAAYTKAGAQTFADAVPLIAPLIGIINKPAQIATAVGGKSSEIVMRNLADQFSKQVNSIDAEKTKALYDQVSINYFRNPTVKSNIEMRFGTTGMPTFEQFRSQFQSASSCHRCGGIGTKPDSLRIDRGDWRFESWFGLGYGLAPLRRE